MLAAGPAAHAAGSRHEIIFQGQLTDASGQVIDGTRNITIRIYDALEGGNQLHAETFNDTPVESGVYAVAVGSTVPLAPALINPDDAATLYMQVEIHEDGEPPRVLLPRQKLGATLFAVNAQKLDGFEASEFVLRSELVTNAGDTDFDPADPRITADPANPLSGDADDVQTALVETLNRTTYAAPTQLRVPTAAPAFDCDAAHAGYMYYTAGEAGGLQICTFDGERATWKTVVNNAPPGRTASNPAASCKAIKEQDPGATDGVYWLGSAGDAYEVYCDMNTAGGGWTLVLKVNNGDSHHFYSNAGVMRSETPINASDVSLARGDHKGSAYHRLPGKEMLVLDLLNRSNHISATMGGSDATVKDYIVMSQDGRWQGGGNGCGIIGSSFAASTGTLASADAVRLGLSCEDDSQSSWHGDDDATIISWLGGMGPDASNHAHTVGIAKVGSDGGDDVQNRGNAAVDAAVAVFWR